LGLEEIVGRYSSVTIPEFELCFLRRFNFCLSAATDRAKVGLADEVHQVNIFTSRFGFLFEHGLLAAFQGV